MGRLRRPNTPLNQEQWQYMKLVWQARKRYPGSWRRLLKSYRELYMEAQR